MLKYISFNILFFLILSVVSHASDATISENYGREKPKTFSLENKYSKNLNSFSIKSKMQFRGENVIVSKQNTYISLNTSVTYQSGQNKYVLPYKKKVILNRITFNPNQYARSY